MKWTSMALIGGLSILALYVAAERVWPASSLKPAGGSGVVFPEVTASNLEGKRYTLPGDLEGERNLCLIAFEQRQQADVDTWLAGVKPLAETPGFEVYEMPTIFKSVPPFRAYLDNAMVKGIPDKRQRERTITLYLDKERFRRSLNLPTEKSIYALLVDRRGNVLWRAEGLFTEEKGKALKAALSR